MRIRCTCIYMHVYIYTYYYTEVTTTAMIGEAIVCVPLGRCRRPTTGFVVNERQNPCHRVHDDDDDEYDEKRHTHTNANIHKHKNTRRIPAAKHA